MTMSEVTPLLLSRTSCTAGNGRFWNIPSTRPMSPCQYDLFAKVKEPLRWTRHNTRDKLICTLGQSMRKFNKDERADGVRRVSNIWQKVINKECCNPVNKFMSKLSNCCHYFLSNLVYPDLMYSETFIVYKEIELGTSGMLI